MRQAFTFYLESGRQTVGTGIAGLLVMGPVCKQSASVVAALAVLMLYGCAGPTTTAYTYPGRSVVFNSPGVQELTESNAVAANALPWYADRNDYQPTTYAGYQGRRSDWTSNRTYDRQRHVAGRVLDHYWSHTRTRRVFSTTD